MGKLPILPDAAQKTLQVMTLREIQRRGVIGGLAHTSDNLGVASGIQRGIRHDFLEKVGLHQSGAREGKQVTPRSQEFNG